MNSNKFILTLLSIVCLGSFTQEHCAQAAIAQACTTSRSLAADGLNAWMSNRYHNSLSNIGMIVNGAFLAGYIYHFIQLKRYNNAYKEKFGLNVEPLVLTKSTQNAPEAQTMVHHKDKINYTKKLLLYGSLAWLISAPSYKACAAFIGAIPLPKRELRMVQEQPLAAPKAKLCLPIDRRGNPTVFGENQVNPA